MGLGLDPRPLVLGSARDAGFQRLGVDSTQPLDLLQRCGEFAFTCLDDRSARRESFTGVRECRFAVGQQLHVAGSGGLEAGNRRAVCGDLSAQSGDSGLQFGGARPENRHPGLRRIQLDIELVEVGLVDVPVGLARLQLFEASRELLLVAGELVVQLCEGSLLACKPGGKCLVCKGLRVDGGT